MTSPHRAFALRALPGRHDRVRAIPLRSRRGLLLAAIMPLLLVPDGAPAAVGSGVARAAVSYPVRCSSVSVSGARFSRVTVTRAITCGWGRTVLRRWSSRRYTRRGVPDGRGNRWFCDFTRSVGRDSRRGDCVAGKNGGIAFTLTYQR